MQQIDICLIFYGMKKAYDNVQRKLFLQALEKEHVY